MSVDKSAVTGDLGQRNVCSAVVKNQTSGKVRCFVEYRTVSGAENEVIEFDLDGNGKEQKCEQKVLTGSTNNTDKSSFSKVFPQVIYSLNVQKADGSTLQVTAPFDNVPNEDVRNWKFTIDNDQIHSGKN